MNYTPQMLEQAFDLVDKHGALLDRAPDQRQYLRDLVAWGRDQPDLTHKAFELEAKLDACLKGKDLYHRTETT